MVEIDAERMKVARTFRVSAGKEQGFDGMAPRNASSAALPATAEHGAEHASANTDAHAGMNMSMLSATCSPTWAQPSIDGGRVYVACNKSNEIVEVDTKTWKLVRRIPAGNGVYNLGASPDGTLLVATNKRDASVSIFSTDTGKELARIPTKRKVLHGVAITPDSRYAFVTVEGVGSEPGTVEIIDLKTREKSPLPTPRHKPLVSTSGKWTSLPSPASSLTQCGASVVIEYAFGLPSLIAVNPLCTSFT